MSQKWGAGSRIGRTNSRLYYRGHLSEFWLILMLLHLPVAGFQRWGFHNSCIFEMVNDHTGAGHCSYLKIACSEQKNSQTSRKPKKWRSYLDEYKNTPTLSSCWSPAGFSNNFRKSTAPAVRYFFFSRCFVGEAPSTVPGCRLLIGSTSLQDFPQFSQPPFESVSTWGHGWHVLFKRPNSQDMQVIQSVNKRLAAIHVLVLPEQPFGWKVPRRNWNDTWKCDKVDW